MNIPDNFHIVDHSLIKHKISILRDINTRSKEFRELTTEITSLLAYQATKDLTLSSYDIETPTTATKGHKIELDNIIYKQPLTLDDVNNVFSLGKEIGIDIRAFYIIGFPRENLKQIIWQYVIRYKYFQ